MQPRGRVERGGRAKGDGKRRKERKGVGGGEEKKVSEDETRREGWRS